MEYNTKLTFHIPLYTKINDKVIKTEYSDFERTLISKFTHEFDCRLQLSMIKVPKFGDLYDENLLVVHCSSEDTIKFTDIFLHLICDYHSDLMQDEYQYEMNDILVTIKGVDSKT